MAVYRVVPRFDDGDPATFQVMNQIIDNIDAVREDTPRMRFTPYGSGDRNSGIKIAVGSTYAGTASIPTKAIYVDGMFTPLSRPVGFVTVSSPGAWRWMTGVSRLDKQNRILTHQGMFIGARMERLDRTGIRSQFHWMMIGY